MNIPSVNLKGTPFGGVKFTFCAVTPGLAAAWLKRNRNNRRQKSRQLDKYIMDMRNGAWLTTHECLAFDAHGDLIDGQHRLEALVRAKTPVTMVVSTGWPREQGKKKTMDALNMGANRSLADQLHLQHGIERRHALNLVRICNALAAACLGLVRVPMSTTDTLLAVFALYKNELSWWLAAPLTQPGLKQATVAACLVMARAVWADKTEDARLGLESGENLSKENPLLHLRNWPLGCQGDNLLVRQAVFHHLAAFVDGRSLPQIILNSNAAYARVLKLHKVRAEKICALYQQPLPEFLNDATSKVDTKKVGAMDAEAIKVGESLSPVFTSTDLIARTELDCGRWLMLWLQTGWIESAGVREYRKTANFGKFEK